MGGAAQGLKDTGCREPTNIQRTHNDVQMDTLQAACGWKHSAAVTTSGKLLTWGWGGSMGTQMYVASCGGLGVRLAALLRLTVLVVCG